MVCPRVMQPVSVLTGSSVVARPLPPPLPTLRLLHHWQLRQNDRRLPRLACRLLPHTPACIARRLLLCQRGALLCMLCTLPGPVPAWRLLGFQVSGQSDVQGHGMAGKVALHVMEWHGTKRGGRGGG